jgi:hypothetical protein
LFSDLHHRFHDLDEPGFWILSWVGGIQTIHVSEEKEKIGVYHRGSNSGQRVVVPKADFLMRDEKQSTWPTFNATDADGYCVVFIDDRYLGLTGQDHECTLHHRLRAMKRVRMFTYYTHRQEFSKRIHSIEVSCSL